MCAARLRSTEFNNVLQQRREIEPEEMHSNHNNAYHDKDETVTIEAEARPEDMVGLERDRRSIVLLTFLYVLQGIPLGIAASIPYLLQTRKISYTDQAVFSFVHWPFSLKLFWAPIVDSVYVFRFGRRKSWLIPTQYLIGLFMVLLSTNIHEMMGEEGEQSISVSSLTAVFFALNFLAATQDIAVDGWALTMLSKRNVGWVSTCNTVGQTAGYFLGNVVFLALESTDFCNKYLRTESQSTGVVTLSSFLYFWGIIFFITTTLVMILKHESNAMLQHDHDNQSVVSAYHQLWKIVQLPSVLALILILLTIKIGFAAADAVTGLKLIEEGVPREHLAMVAVPMVPIDIVLAIVITKYMSSERPLDVFLKAMPFRLVLGLGFAVFVWWAPMTKISDGTYPLYFYAVLLLSSALHQAAVYSMYVPVMAFFAKVSDPVIGGTYMTLLNTISNLGGNWPSTVALWLVDGLTWRGCKDGHGVCSSISDCSEEPKTACTLLDGYYVESVACFVIGVVWLKLRGRKLRELQELGPEHWICRR